MSRILITGSADGLGLMAAKLLAACRCPVSSRQCE